MLIMTSEWTRLYVDYGDIVFGPVYKKRFHRKLESSQCKASAARIEVIRGTSEEKPYQEIGLDFSLLG